MGELATLGAELATDPGADVGGLVALDEHTEDEIDLGSGFWQDVNLSIISSAAKTVILLSSLPSLQASSSSSSSSSSYSLGACGALLR